MESYAEPNPYHIAGVLALVAPLAGRKPLLRVVSFAPFSQTALDPLPVLWQRVFCFSGCLLLPP